MSRAYYSASIEEFLKSDEDIILGELLKNDEFSTSDLQKNSWKYEIGVLKDQLTEYSDGDIAFEYTIPRLGHRIDVVVIYSGILFLLEFKSGDGEYKKSTDDQVMDYALDLKYFHEKSESRYIIPVNVSTEAINEAVALNLMDDKIANIIHANKNTIKEVIKGVSEQISDTNIPINEWINSRYVPTPTIIEAAQTLYKNHTVKNITKRGASAKNLSDTNTAINNIIDNCKAKKRKAICFVTGVPGAGKTLAGLDIANQRHQFEDDEHAVFLSGNGPLVDVLQEALARDRAKREGISKSKALMETKAFIQIIHKFRDEALTTDAAPIEKVAIFDEAQRAWNEAALTDFMARKKGTLNFDQSEPEFLISIMDRHKDWATIVCLVGGGQEIYKGEGGIRDWFDVLRRKYNDWDIYVSDKLSDTEYIGESTLNGELEGRKYNIESSLHLGVSLRSFRSENLAYFVKCVLDNEPGKAKVEYQELKKKYPLFITRDLSVAKKWVRNKARGTERYGLLASSEGKRLRGDGIWVLPEINHVGWFLNGKENVDSSYQLEVAASEFKVQGLEIDYGLLAWDIDFRYVDGKFDYYKFRGTSWNHNKLENNQNYQKNAYRVLLTRARQGLVIYVPKGTSSSVDSTRDHRLYDSTYEYLMCCGIEELKL